MIYLLLFLEGILAFVSPCILPMVPVYLVYLGGDDRIVVEQDKKLFQRRVLNTLAFILGFTLIFVSLGAIATGIGSYLNTHMNSIRKVSGIIIILIGIYYLDLIHLPERWKALFVRKKKNESDDVVKEGGLLRSFLFGLAFSTTWLPCVGTFLASALTLAANRNTVFEGMGMLFIFAMGLGIPFLITALLFEKLRSTFSFLKRHGKTVRAVSGGLLILLGLSMLLDLQSFYMGLFN